MPCFAKAQILWDIVSYNIEKAWHDGMTNMVFNFSWHRIVSFSDNYIISKRNWKRVAWKKISKGALLKFLEILEQMQDLSYSSACPLVNMLRAATRYVEQTSREREQAIDMHRTRDSRSMELSIFQQKRPTSTQVMISKGQSSQQKCLGYILYILYYLSICLSIDLI